jgi:Zn-dependent protease with chaperone function
MISGEGRAMAMTQEQFDSLVKRLEVFAHRHPKVYRRRVWWLALLGYAYIALVVVALIGVTAGFIYFMISARALNSLLIKALLVLLAPVAIVGRSLFVRLEPPHGEVLRRTQVPNLFALVNQLSTKLQVPKFHQILLTQDFNAAVVQVPHVGLFAGYKNYLILGLPLMQSLSVDQFRAVLAHELGHISGNHSRFGGWIYRQWAIWRQIQVRLHQNGQANWIPVLTAFLDWYAPFFNAYSFVLRRTNEYEADRCAAEVAGANVIASALVAVELKTRMEQSFWTEVYQQVSQQITPPTGMLVQLAAQLRGEMAPEGQAWQEEALAGLTNTLDTHPCLSDRLLALGYSAAQSAEIPLPPALSATAADKLLGNALPTLISKFEQDWMTSVKPSWQQRHAQAQDMEALSQKDASELTAEEAWKLGSWAFEQRQDEKAISLLRACLALQSDHLSANFMLGQILLSQDDFEGVGYIKQAMDLGFGYVLPGCELLYHFYQKQGQMTQAQTYEARYQQHQDLMQKARAERSTLGAMDQFLPHALEPKDVGLLRQQLSEFAQVKEAYLVQKVLQHSPENPMYVLAIVRQQSWYTLDSGNDEELLAAISNHLRFPEHHFMVVSADASLRRKLQRVNVSRIYSK